MPDQTQNTQVQNQTQVSQTQNTQSFQPQKPTNFKKLKEALRKEVERKILKELGVSSLEEAKMKISGKTQKQEKQKQKTDSSDEFDFSQLEYEIKMELMDAGVKKEDLDYAVWKFANLITGKSEEEIKQLELKDFIKTLPNYVFKTGKNPSVEGSNITVEQQSATGGQTQSTPSGEGAKLETKPEDVGKSEGDNQKQFVTTGAPAPQDGAKPKQTAGRNFADLSVPHTEVEKRWREIMTQFSK
jgi:hypothetical protein